MKGPKTTRNFGESWYGQIICEDLLALFQFLTNDVVVILCCRDLHCSLLLFIYAIWGWGGLSCKSHVFPIFFSKQIIPYVIYLPYCTKYLTPTTLHLALSWHAHPDVQYGTVLIIQYTTAYEHNENCSLILSRHAH